MTNDKELDAKILRYHFVEHWGVNTIADQLGIHRYENKPTIVYDHKSPIHRVERGVSQRRLCYLHC